MRLKLPLPKVGDARIVISHGWRANNTHAVSLCYGIELRTAFNAGTVRKSRFHRMARRAAGKQSLFSMEKAYFSHCAPCAHRRDSVCSLHPENDAYAAYKCTRQARANFGEAATPLDTFAEAPSPLHESAGGHMIELPAGGFVPLGSTSQYTTSGILPLSTWASLTARRILIEAEEALVSP